MRILFTNTGPWGSGAGTVIDGVAKELIAMGHHVKIIFPDAGLPSPDIEKYYGNQKLYHIIRFPITHRGVAFPTFPLIIPDPNPRNVQNAWTYKDLSDDEFEAFVDLLSMEFSRVIDTFKPDIIETSHIWLMGYVFNQLGYPYVVAAHNSDQMGFRYDARMQPYAISCARGARYILTISMRGKKEIAALYGVPPDKIIYIPNGYDQDLFTPRPLSKSEILRRYGIKTDAALPLITFVGKLSATKGFDTLLEANALLQKEMPCTIVIFGSGTIGDVYPTIPPPGDRMNNVHLMGHRTAEVIADIHTIADLSVLPSRHEGFGIAALEAMGCGLPVIATRVGEFERFVVGDLVSPDDPAALAAAVRRILRLAPKDRETLRTKARATALRYSWRDITKTRLLYYANAAEREA